MNTYIATGQYVIGNNISAPSSAVIYSLAYRYVGDQPKLSYQHMSYDFIQDMAPRITPKSNEISRASKADNSPHLLDATSRVFIRELLVSKGIGTSISIKVGTSNYYINPTAIVYLQSNDHRTSVYCVDNIIDASMSFG